jgi:hypothetical protein
MRLRMLLLGRFAVALVAALLLLLVLPAFVGENRWGPKTREQARECKRGREQ